MSESFDPRCPLCQLEKITHWYYEEPSFAILDCEVCMVPMAVWRQHGEVDTSAEGYIRMLKKLGEVADQVLGQGKWWLDPVERMIPGHRHAHARSKGWW